jgi:AraC-like DNA-binding protein
MERKIVFRGIRMPLEKHSSMVEALGVAIERIRENYGRDWMKTDHPETGDNYFPLQPEEAEDRYIRIFEPEYHGYTEICACISGSFALQMNRTIVDMREGDVCLILPGLLHNELPRQEGDYSAVWVVIDFNRAVLHLSGRRRDLPFFTFEGCFLKPDYEYIHMIDSIRIEMETKKGYYEEIVKAMLLRLFVTAYREIGSERMEKPEGESWKESVILEVQKYIMSNYTRHIRLNDVSQVVCISPNYLNTIFKSATGKTIMQYHEDYRLDMARKLLQGSEQSINDISGNLGYYDQYHFSKIFKKVTGMSPLQYRKAQMDFTSK